MSTKCGRYGVANLADLLSTRSRELVPARKVLQGSKFRHAESPPGPVERSCPRSRTCGDSPRRTLRVKLQEEVPVPSLGFPGRIGVTSPRCVPLVVLSWGDFG